MESRIENARQFAEGEEYKICHSIESRITTAKALEMYVLSQNGDISDFLDVAAFYYEDDPAIRSIQLAPNDVVSKDSTYPQESGNFVKHDLFADPERREDAEKSRDSRQIMLSGPFELRQGGRGVIIRNPIYLKDEHGQENFWGFSTVVFNVPEIFNIEQLNLLTSDSYYYRLWRHLPDQQEKQVIVENTEKELKGAIRKEVEIYNAVWYLDIAPQDGWLPIHLLIMLLAVFSVIVFLSMIGIASHLKIREVVYYDSVLKVGNGNCLSAVFERLPQSTLMKMYLVIFDIDKFKEFNYIYGEENGDRLLEYIVRVFREEFPGTYLFRYYSDFFITLDQCEGQGEIVWKMERLLERFERDIQKEAMLPFEISAGVRKIEKDEPLQKIISDALIARGTIKGNHLRHYAFYNDEIRSRRIEYMKMESGFAKALREKEFCVFYQPKFDICSGKVIGAEALTRWVQADGTVIGAGAFIPCFEDSRQIVLLDEYILREVCRQMMEMKQSGLEVKPISVNLSRIHLRNPDILPKITAIIKESGIVPSDLSFEITESALLEESIPMREIIDYFHELGCKVEMDDYGVGASNPDALLSNNFDVLKIDKSLVDRIGDGRAEDLIQSTVDLARKWGFEVLAEGVEESIQAERLAQLGCTRAQGFYYSRPIPEEEYRALLEAGTRTEA